MNDNVSRRFKRYRQQMAKSKVKDFMPTVEKLLFERPHPSPTVKDFMPTVEKLLFERPHPSPTVDEVIRATTKMRAESLQKLRDHPGERP